MRNNLIFVGGVHGVGKTFVGQKICENCGFEYVSASQLIKKHVECHKDKRVPDITGNQNVLAYELERLKIGDEAILLDGHFTLINSDDVIIDIPVKVFEQIKPVLIIVILNDVKVIARQVYERDAYKIDEDFLSIHQDREYSNAMHVATLLSIPLISVNAGQDIDEIINHIFQHIRR